MFVETMTFKEIRREMEKDKVALIMKVVDQSRKIKKLMRQTNMSKYDKSFEYRSPNKNIWTYRFKAVSRREELMVDTYCLFYTEKSYAVIMYALNNDRIYYCHSHFFKRYFERDGLESENLHEVVRSYIDGNTQIACQPLKEVQPGIWEVFGQSSHGVALGYRYTEHNIDEHRTFISNNMLKGEQVELSKTLEEKFKIHVVRQSPASK